MKKIISLFGIIPKKKDLSSGKPTNQKGRLKMNLSLREINIMIEALDCWVKKDKAKVIANTFMSTILSSMKEEETGDGSDIEERAEQTRKNVELEEQHREETATMIKAKLYNLRNNLLEKEGK